MNARIAGVGMRLLPAISAMVLLLPLAAMPQLGFSAIVIAKAECSKSFD
jgi:hypothetical protein